jgi:hypothetical protein
MFVISDHDLLNHAQRLALAKGEHGHSLDDHFADRKVIDLAAVRLKLRSKSEPTPAAELAP